jgi:glycine C-acetyltransferase
VVGGVVAGSALVVEWLRQRGRPFLFSSAITAADAAACLAPWILLEESTELVDRLWENAATSKPNAAAGLQHRQSVTPHHAHHAGRSPLAQQFSRELFEEGVFAMAIGFPTVPRGKARIRVMISAAHSREDSTRAWKSSPASAAKLGVIWVIS